MKRITTFMALAILLSCAVTVMAHHGTGISYTNTELITKKATVTSLEFKNPHVALFFDTKDESGKITHWSGEMAAPSVYLRQGWSKKACEKELMPGTEVTISYYVSKVQEQLPPGIGAALVARIRNAKGERVMLDR